MLVFGSEMHLITYVLVIFELMLLAVQWYRYLSCPEDKSLLWYLILLGLLIFYNVTCGLFPDPKIPLPIVTQNIIAYGAGFLMAAYFPFYFYKSFDLKLLRFQAFYGVHLFLLLPYFMFFVLIYGLMEDLDFALRYGLIIPFGYSIYMMWAIFIAIKAKFRAKQSSLYCSDSVELIGVYCAVLPWACLSLFTYFNINQWLEVLVTNLGFLFLTIFFTRRSVIKARVEEEQRMTGYVNKQHKFQKRCESFGLTPREKKIAELLCSGLMYKEIAVLEFISEKTVDTHIRHIFSKTGVNKKIELMQKLGFAEEFMLSHNASYS
ncbi:helix-turn-helix transcriptional regulator [Pedobacter gandavensis]|uniref:helix-turn-helix transcriptional regulator n=1 Tax=Pedobacter gandavensis TaxID=2679963 RepID=UPI00247A84D3|nr:helix-turn-helix transcriptional regulator [Pedobacter gandavensis]WGQ09714.1 helix-turn-helix transcriptional regulator [Pedobacter gandavensis]